MSPTPTLEQHLMWDDIAILLRYLLMLSFNNSLDGTAVLRSLLIDFVAFTLLIPLLVSAEPFSHGTWTLRCLQKEMATYRH